MWYNVPFLGKEIYLPWWQNLQMVWVSWWYNLLLVGRWTWVSQFHKSYKHHASDFEFTHEWSKTEINFLDLTLYKGERFKNTQILDIKCFNKPCDTFQYLSRDSSHPNACFSGMVKGEAICYIQNSSSETEYEQKLDFFISKLLTREYKK